MSPQAFDYEEVNVFLGGFFFEKAFRCMSHLQVYLGKYSNVKLFDRYPDVFVGKFGMTHDR